MSRNLEDLALAAATAWLDWEPRDGDPVGCPGPVADAITAWAEALLPDRIIWTCPLCWQVMKSPESAEGCRDPKCPAVSP